MQLYAVRYGQSFKYGTLGSIFFNSKQPEQMFSDFTFLYYIAKYKGKTILFDTGFRDTTMAQAMGITLYNVDNERKEIIKSPPYVDIVVITHSHWDHINNLDLYTKAQIIIAKGEYEIAMKESPEAIRNCLGGERVITVEDKMWIEDKFQFQVVGGHTVGSSVISFEEKGNSYIITGDECYVCKNLYDRIPIGIYSNLQRNKEFLWEAHEKGWIPLTYHDGGILSKYKKVSRNIVQIL